MSMMIVDPYRFGGALGDVTMAVQNFTTGGTGATTFSVPSATLTGVTPEAIISFTSRALESSGSSPSLSAFFAMAVHVDGATDGQGIFAGAANGQANTTNARLSSDDQRPLKLRDTGNGATNLTASVKPESGGASVDALHNQINVRAHYLALAGADIQVKSGVIALGTGTSAIDVNTVGFQPDAVIFLSNCNVDNSLEFTFFTVAIGFAHSDGTQRAFNIHEADNLAVSTPFAAIRTGASAFQIDATTGGLSYSVSTSDYDSSGFSVTPSASAGNDDLAYLAIKSGRRIKVFDITTPTSTGNQSITGIGFQPQAVILLLTPLTGVDPSFPLTSGATMGGFSIATIADETWSTAVSIEAGATTTNNDSNCQAEILHPTDISTSAGRATLVSFDSNGFTINWSAVHGSATRGFGIAFE